MRKLFFQKLTGTFASNMKNKTLFFYVLAGVLSVGSFLMGPSAVRAVIFGTAYNTVTHFNEYDHARDIAVEKGPNPNVYVVGDVTGSGAAGCIVSGPTGSCD